jgi:hypothetical protein
MGSLPYKHVRLPCYHSLIRGKGVSDIITNHSEFITSENVGLEKVGGQHFQTCWFRLVSSITSLVNSLNPTFIKEFFILENHKKKLEHWQILKELH